MFPVRSVCEKYTVHIRKMHFGCLGTWKMAMIRFIVRDNGERSVRKDDVVREDGKKVVFCGNKQQQTMASVTVDPIDLPLPFTLHRAVPPEHHQGVELSTVQMRATNPKTCSSH